MSEDRQIRRLKLRELRILMAVIQAESMAKAARQLAISQPAVSRAIADMEHTLEVPLSTARREASSRRDTAALYSDEAWPFSTS
jgi:molybdenum-dependent DNA-binding transcriptional regulator ModE